MTTARDDADGGQDKETELDLQVSALRKAVMAPPTASATSTTTTTTTAPGVVAKNQASKFVRQMLKSSWIAQTDGQLLADIVPAIEGGCVYLPGFLCGPKDFALLRALTQDLQHFNATTGEGMISWSAHLKFENPAFSPTFQALVRRMEDYFDVEVLASRLNFYRDGSDWKPYHHDSHAFSGGKKEDFTVGASFGSTRELAFKHVASGQIFSFPQGNGDIFAFDSEVNKAFQHGVPKMKGGEEKGAGPRFSIIAWGRRRTLNERNSAVTARALDGGERGQEMLRKPTTGMLQQQQQESKSRPMAMAKKASLSSEEDGEEKVAPIGMDEVARLVEKMVLKEEAKQQGRVGKGTGADKGKEKGEEGESDGGGAKKAGGRRRGGRVQHSWAA